MASTATWAWLLYIYSAIHRSSSLPAITCFLPVGMHSMYDDASTRTLGTDGRPMGGREDGLGRRGLGTSSILDIAMRGWRLRACRRNPPTKSQHKQPGNQTKPVHQCGGQNGNSASLPLSCLGFCSVVCIELYVYLCPILLTPMTYTGCPLCLCNGDGRQHEGQGRRCSSFQELRCKCPDHASIERQGSQNIVFLLLLRITA